MPTTPHDHAGVIAHPPHILATFLVVGLVLHVPLGIHVASWPVSLGLGLVVGTLSATLALRAERQLLRAGTTIVPAGSTTAIVRSGPYAYSRNPMYMAQGLLFAMIALCFNSMSALLMLVPWFLTIHFGVVLREERYLAQKFGETYKEYQRSVRRWL